MERISCSVCLLVCSFLGILTPSHGDVQVSCVFMASCMLPCSFQGGSDAVIHWNQLTTGNTPVHSYYSNQDQLGLQDQRFKNRTSLFKDQISRGNASLQLTGVEVQDQGRYQCFTSTISGDRTSYIILTVEVSDPPADEETQTNTGTIVGVVVAILVLAVIVGLAAFCVCKKKQQRSNRNGTI